MASPPRMEIDTNAAPEQTTCWADAVDAPGNGRRCWADESECLSPEFAPISFLGGGGSTKSNGFKKLDGSNRFFPADDDTQQYSLDELHPPFNAFVGGLSFHIDEQDLANFFSGRNCKVSCVRLPREDPKKGKGTRSKGFGYVEFVDARSLKLALQQNGTMFQDRKIKVDIADRDDRPVPTKKGSGGRRKGERERDPWLKDPPRNQKSSGKGSSQGKSGRGQGGNDWYGDQRSGRGGGATERYEPRYEPMGASAGGGYGDSRGLGYIAAGSSGSFGAGTRGNVFGNGAGAAAGSERSPAERVPLKLASRKEAPQDGSPSQTSAPSETPKKKVDPFGGAKPRDEFEYERRHAAEEAAKKEQARAPPVPAPQEAAPIHSPQFQPQPQPPPPPQHHPQQSQQSQQLQSQPQHVLSAKEKKKQDNGHNKQLQAQSQQMASVKEKKKQEIVNESYTSGWAANDWDWNGGGWNETRSTSRPKGGAANRGGKGKKGKGRGGKRSGSIGGGNADQDANWRD